MSVAAVLISVEEYLDTAYSPDREFVNGVVVERQVGERPHSLTQRNITVYLANRARGAWVWPEQRVRLAPNRFRIPDIGVTLQDPGTDIFDTPPLVGIEILSRRDETSDVLEKLAEYHAFGVTHIWLIDPRRKKAFVFDGALHESTSASLTAPEADIDLPLAAVFEGL